MRHNRKIRLTLFVILFTGYFANACTAFYLKTGNNLFTAKSYDWKTGTGCILINPRSIQKVAFPTRSGNVFSWKSKYGSISFNQYGDEHPNGGINEKGLVVEVLWLSDAIYPVPANHKTLNELQWIQYQLDNSASVQDVIESLKQITVDPVFANVHYFIGDALGNAAVIDFVDGKTVVHTGKKLSYSAITNNTYTQSENFMQKPENLNEFNSLQRFKRTVNNLNIKDHPATAKRAFTILRDVWVEKWTKWNIVYDNSNRKVHLRTQINGHISEIAMENFSFMPGAPKKALSLDSLQKGDISPLFYDFSLALNHQLLKKSIKKTGIGFTKKEIKALAWFPDTTKKRTQTLFRDFYNRTVNLTVVVKNLPSNKGAVNIGLMDSKASFENIEPIKAGRIEIRNKQAKISFYNITKGEYAVGVYHDKNNNGVVDKSWLNIPQEKYGFSNNARKFARLPDWEDAKFTIEAEYNQIIIKL